MQYRTYYVSSETGNDCYDGLSKTTPFATLKRLQQCKLYPGDQILLECGSVFEEQYLHISDSGSKELPIEIGAYGNGALPKIHANGTGIWYQDYGMLMLGVLICTLPTAVIFFCLQKSFSNGLTGAVK